MFTNRPDPWTEHHQRTHSRFWSSFLGLSSLYDTRRFNYRYDVSRTAEVVEELLQRWLTDAEPKPRPSFVKLVLWTLAPQVGDVTEGADRRQRDVGIDPMVPGFRTAFADAFGFQPAADRGWDPERLVIPVMPELGIEGASVKMFAYPRSVRARLETIVTRPFGILRGVVEPMNWKSCPFWTKLPSTACGSESVLPVLSMAVRLPGGDLLAPSTNPKERDVIMRCEIASSAFEARIDYESEESGRGRLSAIAGPPPPREAEPQFEIDGFRGFLHVEKLAGRPGACRIVAEREARFLDFNHEHFRAETVLYWLASEILAVVEDLGGSGA